MRGSGSVMHLLSCSFSGGDTAVAASAGGVIDVKDCQFSRHVSSGISVGSMSVVTCTASSIVECGTGILADACERMTAEGGQISTCSVGKQLPVIIASRFTFCCGVTIIFVGVSLCNAARATCRGLSVLSCRSHCGVFIAQRRFVLFCFVSFFLPPLSCERMSIAGLECTLFTIVPKLQSWAVCSRVAGGMVVAGCVSAVAAAAVTAASPTRVDQSRLVPLSLDASSPHVEKPVVALLWKSFPVAMCSCRDVPLLFRSATAYVSCSLRPF